MKNYCLLILLLLSGSLFSQTFREEFSSNVLAGKREIKIKLPASFETNKDKDKKYPLILVLDSEFLFPPFEGNVAYTNYWQDMPEVVMVGINQNKNSEREDDSEFDATSGLPVKKGAAFFEFIGMELLPYLEKKYKVGSFKVITGLDITASMANIFLLKGEPIFSAYISLSPDLANNMEIRIPQRLDQIKQRIFYYQATGSADSKDMQEGVRLLDSNIKGSKNPFLAYKFDDFKDATHFSLVPLAIPNALQHIFSVYQPISSAEYQEKIVTLKDGYADYLIKKYDSIEKTLGIKMEMRLNDFIAVEKAIEKNKAYDEYEKLAQISGQRFPKTMMYDYHMGMYYEKKNEVKKALKYYQNAYGKQPIGDITSDFVMNKAEDIKKLLPKKGLKAGKLKEAEGTETPPDTPSDTPPTDAPPADAPKEEKKP